MTQTKTESVYEVLCNVVSGLLTAWATWVWIIMPWVQLLNLDPKNFTFLQIMLVNLAFTIVSMFRGYFWRRTFNARIWKNLCANLFLKPKRR